MEEKEITLGKGVKHIAAKYGLAAVVSAPLSITLGGIMGPICVGLAKTKPGKIIAAVGVIVSGSAISGAVGLAVSDKILAEACPKEHKKMTKYFEDISPW